MLKRISWRNFPPSSVALAFAPPSCPRHGGPLRYCRRGWLPLARLGFGLRFLLAGRRRCRRRLRGTWQHYPATQSAAVGRCPLITRGLVLATAIAVAPPPAAAMIRVRPSFSNSGLALFRRPVDLRHRFAVGTL